MSYKSMFGDAKKTNLFGEAKTEDVVMKDIEAWRDSKGVKTPAGKIKFAINGLDVSKMTPADITIIGEHHVNEATEANRCVDQVVSDYAAMKHELEGPKSLILRAVQRIEEASRPQGFFSRLAGAKTVDWAGLRSDVNTEVSDAHTEMKKVVKWHLEPFIAGLEDAKFYLGKISEDLDNTINALDYIVDRSSDQIVQDLARRRKEMFAKSLQLMQLNKGQLDSMNGVCEQNRHFATELEMTMLPLIQNVMRSSVIDNKSGEDAMKDIQSKLKGIL